MITAAQLKAIMPRARQSDIALIIDPLNETLVKYEINTPRRIAAFIGQVAQETMSLYYREEDASGIAYEWRKSLGNVQAGDGVRFKGRGLLQITGRVNYEHCARETGLDIVNHPQIAASPKGACEVSGWFWKVHGLNAHADLEEYVFISKVVNGGTNGLDQRLEFTKVALGVLGA